MKTTGSIVRAERIKSGFTQQQVAVRLGISRPTYIDIEKGKRDLYISEARTLAVMFGVPPRHFLGEKDEDFEKYKQMMFLMMREHGGKVDKQKLAALLYLADFAWYYRTLESMSGMKYRKM